MQITYKKISTGIRPIKIAIFFNKDSENWRSIIDGIIEIYSTVWGGLQNVIIPTNGKTIDGHFLKLLTEFDPDLYYYYQHTNIDRLYSPNGQEENEAKIAEVMRTNEFSRDQAERFIARNVHSEEIDIFKDNIEFVNYLHSYVSPFGALRTKKLFKLFRRRVHANGMFEIGDYLNEAIEVLPTRPYYFDLTECTDDVRLLISSYTGLGEHLYSSRLDITKEAITQSTEIGLLNDLHSGRLSRLYPFAISGFGLTALYRQSSQSDFSLLIVGAGPDNFSLFYGLHKIMDGIYWLPSVNSFLDPHPSLGFITLEQIVDKNNESSRTGLKITSCTLTKDDLLEVVNEIRNSGISDCSEHLMKIHIIEPNELEIIREFELYEHGNSKNTYIQQFDNGNSTNYIETPYPKSFKKMPPFKANWIVDYEIEGLDSNDCAGYVLPNDPTLITNLIQSESNKPLSLDVIRKHGNKYAVRCPIVGLRYGFMTPQDVTPKPLFKLQESEEIFSTLFKRSGYNIASSDKGNYLQYSLKIFGGIEGLAKVLQNESIWNILSCFKNETSGKKRLENGIKGIKLKTGVYISYEDLRSFFTDDNSARDFMNEFIKRNVLTRGFIFKCEQCANDSWYNINAITDRFTCPRCDHSQVYLQKHWRKGDEPVFYYRLNEMFFQGFNHNMKEPLLGLYFLKSTAIKSFFSLPELILLREDDDSFKQEIDMACIVDGELWIGEAKSGGLNKDDINKYVDPCNKMKANFILVSNEPVSKDIEGHTKTLPWKKPPVIKILNTPPKNTVDVPANPEL